jgi:hypothetical protein
MKKIIFILCALAPGASLLLISAAASAQNEAVENYFKNKGVVLLANCAHPSNTFEGGTYAVYDQYVIVDIAYTEGVHTKLRVDRQGYGFSRVFVLADNDFVHPFSFMKVVSDLALAQYKDSDAKNEVIRNLENMLNRELKDWKGTDWALLLVNLDYFSN